MIEKDIIGVSNRLKKAIKNKENIILYGDADLDGISSVILLEETIKTLGSNKVFAYFPDREQDGYGLTLKACEELKNYFPALLILLDCGIGNFSEVKKAKEFGFEIIIIDHHEILKKLPKADIILDPKKDKKDTPLKNLSNGGLCFKLIEKILSKNFSPFLRKSFLELVALSTIADLMPLEDDNITFINEGIESLKNTFRPGLKAVKDYIISTGENLSDFEMARRISSYLNISKNENHFTKTYLLLKEENYEKAKLLAKDMIETAKRRYEETLYITQELIEKIEEKDNFILEGGPDIPLYLTGAVASKICQKFNKPTFIFHQEDDISKGSVRTPKGMNSVKILQDSSKFLLEGFGGHSAAAGFSIKNENLKLWEEFLKDYFKKNS
ncbi:MAG: DHH family phosphoesterase [Minisyncoccia bacterium]